MIQLTRTRSGQKLSFASSLPPPRARDAPTDFNSEPDQLRFVPYMSNEAVEYSTCASPALPNRGNRDRPTDLPELLPIGFFARGIPQALERYLYVVFAT